MSQFVLSTDWGQALVIGFVTGLLSGGFGIGGGVLATPLMRMWLGLNPHVAVGTTLALIVPTALSGAINYIRKKMVSLPLVACCAPPSVVGTICGSIATHYVHGSVMMFVMSLLIGFTGFDLLTGFGKKLRNKVQDLDTTFVVSSKNIQSAVLLGLCVGFLSGFVGIGGGFVMIPMFMFLYGLPIKLAFGTSLMVVAAVSLPGSFVHYLHKHVDLGLAITMSCAAIPASYLGSKLALKVQDEVLRKSFGFFLLVLMVVFVYKEVERLNLQ
jgi:uncharacterized membrane protein YfcA